jgi:hypothetical protein
VAKDSNLGGRQWVALFHGASILYRGGNVVKIAPLSMRRIMAFSEITISFLVGV